LSQLVVLSGKGGTGKTSIAAGFVDLFSRLNSSAGIVLVDADVDAANLDLVLSPKIITTEPFYGSFVAEIDQDQCDMCGICQEVCRYDAVMNNDQSFWIDPIACEGCAACIYQCPEIAISKKAQLAGEWYYSNIQSGVFFHAHLNAAQENSGKLVAVIKEKAREEFRKGEYKMMLVDGPPGIGCPVISAVSGADAALIVTEPTISGLHDLTRALETTAHFGIKTYVCINKGDIYPEGADKIKKICAEKNINVVGIVPFDLAVPKAMIQGAPVTRLFPDSRASIVIRKVWDKIYDICKEDSQTSDNGNNNHGFDQIGNKGD
jgi:MinD superfamily P-loop ATPase